MGVFYFLWCVRFYFEVCSGFRISGVVVRCVGGGGEHASVLLELLGGAEVDVEEFEQLVTAIFVLLLLVLLPSCP